MTLDGYYFDGKKSWKMYKKKNGSIIMKEWKNGKYRKKPKSF